MLRDGIYKVVVKGQGATGLVMGALQNGHLTGCDQSHFVTGQCAYHGNRINGEFHFKRHSRPENFHEFAQLDSFTAHFNGICSDTFGEFESHVEGRPDLKLTASFHWLSDF